MPEPALNLLLVSIGAIGNVLVVVAGIGLLIFVHELGHFLVAKRNKVRVEAFSLGFGPVLLHVKRGDTDYRLSLIPLGGYVKMAGETATDSHSEDPAEFQNKSVAARAAVLSAGVIMNAIFGILLFVFAFNVGVPLPSPVVAAVVPGSPAWTAGLEPGDRILAVNGTPVLDFQDVMEEVAFSRGPVSLTADRAGRTVEFPAVEPREDAGAGVRMIGLHNRYELAVDESSPAFEAGLRSGDILLRVNGVWAGDLAGEYESAIRYGGDTLEFLVRRGESELSLAVTPTTDAKPGTPAIGIAPVADRIAAVRPGSAAEKAGFRAGDEFRAINGRPARDWVEARRFAMDAAPGAVTVTVGRGSATADITPAGGPATASGWDDFFRSIAPIGPAECDSRILLLPDREFADGNPARAAGLPDGARIVEVNGKPVATFLAIRTQISETPAAEAVRLSFDDPAGERRSLTVVRRPLLTREIRGLAFAPLTEMRRVPGVVAATKEGFRRTWLTTRRIVQFLGGIVTGRVSAQNLGGPVAIFQISYSAAKRNLVHFMYFLAILSINLAILNILPIPILDGGHLLFLLIEAIRRKPLPQKAMVWFQWAGLVFLLLLMVFVIANDLTRNLR